MTKAIELLDAGRPGEAEPLLRRAGDYYVKCLPKNDNLGLARYQFAVALNAQGKSAEAADVTRDNEGWLRLHRTPESKRSVRPADKTDRTLKFQKIVRSPFEPRELRTPATSAMEAGQGAGGDHRGRIKNTRTPLWPTERSRRA